MCHCVDQQARFSLGPASVDFQVLCKFLKQHYLLTDGANIFLTQVACSDDSFITGSDQGGVVWEWEVSMMDYYCDVHDCHQPDNKSTI